MQIDLKKFCRKSHYIETGTLIEPFSDNDYTYASDGSIIIRVDKIQEITETKHSIKAKELFENNKINGNEIWIDPPKFEVIEKDCTECVGTGKILVCEECNGTGSLEFSSDYNDYDVECKSCFGRDTTNLNEGCEDCDGTGKYKKYSNPVVKIPIRKDVAISLPPGYRPVEVVINGIYLKMIQDLPNIKIALQGEAEIVKLKFDGGIGLMMPMEREKP